VKALTVQQPWAWAIVQGGKDVENRTQAWGYRGPLAIHAGNRISERGMTAVPSIMAAERLVADEDEIRKRMLSDVVHGSIIGMVDLVDVHVQAGNSTAPYCCESWWAEDSYAEHGGRTRRDIVHLVLANPQPLEVPVPCRGALGLWTVPAGVDDQVQAELDEATS
jgi:hypothetical protein